MTAPVKPAPAQLTALRLAARDATGIRYYRGGWYSITAEAGADQRDHRFARLAERASVRERDADPIVAVGAVAYVGAIDGDPSVAATTLDACVKRGWLALASVRPLDGIYSTRWTLTDAGRAVLDAAEVQS